MNSYYLSTFHIGTPVKPVRLDVDSGSSDFWVISPLTQPAPSGTHNLYNPAASSTSQKTANKWSITYGDQSSASGVVYLDTVEVGGVIVKNQGVEVATKVSQQFLQAFDGDGLCGTAFGVLNTSRPQQQPTIIENMITQGERAEGLFTAKLGTYAQTSDPTVNSTSFYTFGYIDQSIVQAHGPLHYTPVVSNSSGTDKGFWTVSSTKILIDGTEYLRVNPPNQSIMDTGTTLLIIDDMACERIYSKIAGAHVDPQNGWVIPQNYTHLPTLSFDIGGLFIDLPPSYLLFSELPDNAGYVGAIQSSGLPSPNNTPPPDIYGDVILRCMYAVFDHTNKRFGCCQLPAPPGEASGAGVVVTSVQKDQTPAW
ncbi:acid protease [Microthyrium microscopicum]|uniref:Acid protease n=1 Tax=Microthyrium microscopicum TaxID=703497 RepID=A0A6A6UUM3_9PEZI|nr:acid protease [Microthyrium microscopicum]